MPSSLNPKLKLYEATFNDHEFSSANNLTAALATESDWLSSIVTHAYGSGSQFSQNNFPLYFTTEGMGGNSMKRVKSTDLSYKVKILGRPKRHSSISKQIYSAGEKPGRGGTKFVAYFKDGWFYKSQSIYSPSGLECRVQNRPVKEGDAYKYELQIYGASTSTFVPVKDFSPNKKWGAGVAKVGKERSRGVEHRSYTPYEATNQLSVVRNTFKIAGNVKNKIMVLEFNADGKKFKYWTQWEMYLNDLEWKAQCEQDLWYSTYNKNEEGIIRNIDEDSGEVVTSGAGVLEQIPNQDNYSFLTTNKLRTLIRDIFFNTSDVSAANVEVEIFTGTGGMEEATKAMEAAAKDFTLVDSKVLSGNTPDLTFNGLIFKRYRHIDGKMVKFTHLPFMDRGMKADISPRHPQSGLPIESYNMYCLDRTSYDGQPNLQFVTEEGRESIDKIVPGMAPIPGYEDTKMIAASDLDASSIERMKTHGMHIFRPTNCFKLLNSLGE